MAVGRPPNTILSFSTNRCAATEASTLASNFDRYELTEESYITTPVEGGNWPLTLTVHNATVFAPELSKTSSESIYMTFFTDDGTAAGVTSAGA